MNKKYYLPFLLLLCYMATAWGSNELTISGKLRLIQPTRLDLKDLKGETILSCPIGKEGAFQTESKEIIPDVYTLHIGKMKQDIYLENNPVTIKGYFDESHPERSSLTFTGIDPFLTVQSYVPTEISEKKRFISEEVKGKLSPGMAAALGYISDVNDYKSNKMLLDMIPENARNSQSAQWLVEKVKLLSRHIIGAECTDFTFVDSKGEQVSLKDFRGKIVVVDFCASWCGPCRREMRSMLSIYNELKGDDLEFISVSLDDKKDNWLKMVEEENLPWIMLWDEEGFPKNHQPNKIQTAYGFYSIPFLVVVDKEGKLAARGVRGEQVREAILKLR